jgi:hypothetical protein
LDKNEEKLAPEYRYLIAFGQTFSHLYHGLLKAGSSDRYAITGFSVRRGGIGWRCVVQALDVEKMERVVIIASAEGFYEAQRNANSSIQKGAWRKDKYAAPVWDTSPSPAPVEVAKVALENRFEGVPFPDEPNTREGPEVVA